MRSFRHPSAAQSASGNITRRGKTTNRPRGEERLLLVFVDQSSCWWLSGLRRGFRHCFAVVERNGAWIVVDPLKSHTALELLSIPSDFDLAAFYADQGHAVISGSTVLQRGHRSLTLRPFTCVEVVKRVIGIHAPLAFTPYQLYRHLLVGLSDRFVAEGAVSALMLDSDQI